MCSGAAGSPKSNEERDLWDETVQGLLNGGVDLAEYLRVSEGDHKAYILRFRALHSLHGDPRIREIMQRQSQKIRSDAGIVVDERRVTSRLSARDAHSRFKIFAEMQKAMLVGEPSLLTGSTFEECLEQYQRLIGCVEKTWETACDLYRGNNYPLSTFLSLLAIEETGKLTRLFQDLLRFDRPTLHPTMPPKKSHRGKHFLAAIAGALVNARLDRVLGQEAVRALLQDACDKEFEKLRQRCLYIDRVDDVWRIPTEAVGKTEARLYSVLAGELIAEVLGHFPWEFRRLVAAAASYEISIGYPEPQVRAV
ncbi:AbiV family abortive infection protein [Kaistia sp. 32K]|uniref:AbiV family abortive infection protein n=1 Tax=Kaistia sp. 32K TaxID=2795690 RepID=UPI0019167DFE|nr:AbiV family abortive infection protein [Kaistia sp. 32K]